MTKMTFLMAVLLLSACATVADKQASCEAQYSTFPEMVSCLKREVASMPLNQMGHRDTDLLNLYVAYADAASARVQSGHMLESDARLMLAELYVRMKNTTHHRDYAGALQYNAMMQGLAAWEYSQNTAPPPQMQMITCRQYGSLVRCW